MTREIVPAKSGMVLINVPGYCGAAWFEATDQTFYHDGRAYKDASWCEIPDGLCGGKRGGGMNDLAS